MTPKRYSRISITSSIILVLSKKQTLLYLSNYPKIVYLLGAGATHAEIMNLEKSPSETFISKNGLLISHVSKRVMKNAQNNVRFKKNVESVTFREGPVNIELLITLFEVNKITDGDFKINYLKKLVHDDIVKRISKNRKKKFFLHKALLELHSFIKDREKLLGIISLNYDDVLDEAYSAFYGRPNYCLTSDKDGSIPLLKLHGSFNWQNIRNYATSKTKNVAIIPLGVNKNYLTPPYNFIWSRAYEILAECDILRVIGCSLSQNDIGLIDLLFKAHLERDKHFDIEIINSQKQGDKIKYDFGFFPGIIKPEDIEESLIADDSILKDPDIGNPFKIWLKAKALRMLKDDIKETKYLIECL